MTRAAYAILTKYFLRTSKYEAFKIVSLGVADTDFINKVEAALLDWIPVRDPSSAVKL